MEHGAYRDMGDMARVMVVVFMVSIPLALWKLAECFAWVCQHVAITIR